MPSECGSYIADKQVTGHALVILQGGANIDWLGATLFQEHTRSLCHQDGELPDPPYARTGGRTRQ